MPSDRQPPSSSSPREGDTDLMDPQPSSSPRSGGRHPDTRNPMNNGNNTQNQRPMMNLDPHKARIFFVKSNPTSQLATVNVFIVKKALTAQVGANHNCTRLRSGTLRVEIQTHKQVSDLLKLTQIQGVPIEVEVPFASNTCKGVVTHYDFAQMSEDDIVTEMANLDVVACRKFFKPDKHTGERRPTNTVCLTFAKTELPDSIYVGYEPRPVYPFIPRPQRCNKCQAFGHGQFACRSQPVCLNCAGKGHQVSQCQASEFKCASCGGPHPASDRTCPVWLRDCLPK